MKSFSKALSFLMCALLPTANAAPLRSRLWKASVAIVLAAEASDAATSLGKLELNPILRAQKGTFNGSSVVLKTAIIGGMLIPQIILHRRMGKVAAGLNFASAGVLAVTAAHNSTVRKAR